MTTNMHLRDVPADVHDELRRRAEATGMSLRQYTIDVLSTHCRMPAVDQWLDRLAMKRVRELATSGAEAVQASRAEDDRRRAHG